MAIYAIGDVQGCDDEFARLLDALRFDPPNDRLWLVGDLVNRGPRSLQVIRRVMALGEAASVVLGNHDLHLLAVAYSDHRRLKSKDTIADVLGAPDCTEIMDWLRHRPMLHHDVELGYTMIHAGLPPQWDIATAQRCAAEVEDTLRSKERIPALFDAMYGDKPDRWSEDLAGWDRLRFITNCLTRLRFCKTDGTLELKYKGGLDQAPSGVVPWFRVPGRRSRGNRIVCGHWSALGYHTEHDVLLIDTGCVWGQQLCAVRLDVQSDPLFVPCAAKLEVEG